MKYVQKILHKVSEWNEKVFWCNLRGQAGFHFMTVLVPNDFNPNTHGCRKFILGISEAA